MRTASAAKLALALAAGGCAGQGGEADACAATPGAIPVTIAARGGAALFCAGVADTEAEQAQGLMYRTDLQANEGLLFAPYPPGGEGPREASFWMKNTPTPLDIIFIRPDRTIARVAENTAPFFEAPIASGEPVSAVLEIRGGRAAELGIAEGDKVDWVQPDAAVEGGVEGG